ncbi:hypothetical protein Fleli_1916 [Bernardetia litoralis DSM 6794]|uniref:Glycosyltransferase RgtA/B/C/D-like domain-containing protein n=1 Tax=Bernardetia litoralis (strain ATCC 23117 / DSM 6794 / NBRC 15988 / NCIMB 1366 / Fx l1 / Sio-4) TaxID=880071 RepID=I4AK21_BERLS|nr:glycosyltransferase family 39 protein [Bernardetia litoralis]AFM04306.1 hypothetical protein Fleli_1916 [Bernardetia litoralis DSM 6794]
MSIKNWFLLSFFALLKLQTPFLLNKAYSFHKDELLYLALGRHLDFGFLEVPPVIALFASFIQNTFGESLWAVHLMAGLAGTALVILTGMIANQMGGKTFAILFAGFIVIFSPAFLRVHTLFQPVGWDILGWTWLIYFWVRHIKTQKGRYLVGMGIIAGIFLLNKYSIIFCIVAILIATLASKERQWLLNKKLWLSFGITFLIILPNFIWQAFHNYPIFHHIEKLNVTQLKNINPLDFIIDQFVMHLPITWVWLLGFTGLLKSKTLKPFKIIALFFVVVILMLLFLHNESYYTLGAFPVMLAAGSVAIERLTKNRTFLRVPAVVIPIMLILPLLPFSIPVLSPEKLTEYAATFTKQTGEEVFNRWKDGKIHAIPQDFANMIGWKEIATLTAKAYYEIPIQERKNTVIFAQNYGQAGAIDFYGKEFNLPPCISFSNNYLLWSPEKITQKRVIYINNDLNENIKQNFKKQTLIGQTTDKYAKEKGTQVWLLENPTKKFEEWYEQTRKESMSFLK